MITEVETYFSDGCGRCDRFETDACSSRKWAEGLATLRRICMEAGLEEDLRWGHPCYRHADRNVAIIGAFQDNFRLSFFEAGLLKDPEGVLEKQGPNSGTPGMIRFTDQDGPERMEGTIRAYLEEAMGYAAEGLRAPKADTMPDWPEELTEALDADPALAEAFHALTPGRQKSYLIHLNSAKASDTRRRRIEKARDKIMAGKGAMER
ncbi:hypothetical protein HKCCE4037_06995 [Rhodobacterales bacterium HKCCE4037]|nr:hypothetical protein [Rhodobacterales bacterium HKCCE4037]